MKRKFAHASMSVLVPVVIFISAVSAQYATPFGKIVQNLITDTTASTADAVFSFASGVMGPPGSKRVNGFADMPRALRSLGDITAQRIDANAKDVAFAGDTIGSFYVYLNRSLPGRHAPEQMADAVFTASSNLAQTSRVLESAAVYADDALYESAGQLADAAMGGANTIHALYASLNRHAPGRDVPGHLAAAARNTVQSLAMTADTFAGSSAAINGTSANILDSIGSAIGSAADAVQSFFLSFLSRPPVVSTVSPSVSVTPAPSVPAGGGTTVTNITTTTSVTQAQLISALRTLLSQGLPADILAQLRGPQGPAGTAGVQGPAGYSIGAVYPTANNPNQAGTFGGVTYFGSKELTTETLTATGTSTLSTLNVSGATTLSSLLVTGATTLPNLVLTSLDISGNGSVSGTFEAATLKGDLILAHIGESTLKTVQDMQNVYHSTGWVSGGEIIPGSGGDITVSEGTGLIRNALTVPGTLATLLFFDWPAVSGITLTDNAENFVYVDYNGGNPTVTVQTSEDTTDYQTRFLLAIVSRVGTNLYVNDTVRPTVGDHAALMIREMQQTMPYTNATGGEITAGTNPLSFNISDGSWWQGLNRFTTPAFDGSTDTFTYYYRNGSGGWTDVPGATQIDTTNYDDGSGVLAALPVNSYGVHWLYISTDGTVSAVYGSGSYTLNGAQNAAQPDSLPVQLQGVSFIVGKIIVKDGAAAFSQIDSVAMMQRRFPGGSVPDHNSLLSLQGGTTDQYYHLTATEHDRWASGSASLAIMPDCSNGTNSKLLYDPTSGVFTCGVDQSGGGAGGGALEFREFRAGGFDSKSIASVSFNANNFNLTASGSDDVTVSLDWINGPASRTEAQTISGAWHFTAASSQFSNTLEIGTASASSATLKTLTVSGQTTLADASSSGTMEALALRAATIGSDTTLTFAPLGAHTFITGAASISTNFEVGGYASASKVFGMGLSTCSTSERLFWDGTTGRFECMSVSTLTGVPFAIREFGSPYLNAASASFSASGFNVTDGSNIANIALDYINGPASRSLANTWTALNTFSAGASVSGGPFEVGTNTLYVNPSVGRVGINTQTLSEALELVGNASISGNVYALGNVGIGTVSPTSRLSILGTTNDSTANALAITNTDATPLLTIRNDGLGAVGMAPTLNATFAVKSQTFNGAANASTTGSSTTVTTTGGAFANVVAGATLVANGQTVQVITHVSDNTIITRTPIDLTGGFPFTYTNASFVAADSNADTSAGLRILNQGNPVWNINSVGAESNRYLYVFSNNARANILRITEMGTIGQNIPYSAANTLIDPPATYAIYPQAFAAVIGSISGTFYDLTTNANTSTDTPTPFTVTPNTDFIYLGIARKFSAAFLERVTGPTSAVVKAEYWNGSSWVTLSGANDFNDGTDGFTRAGALTWNKDSLTGWTTRSINGSSSYYYVRLSFTTYIGGLLRINMIVPGTEDRLAIFKAPLDVNPAFQVNGVGDVGLGNRMRDSRVQDSSIDDDAALSVIDTRGSLRLWAFDASKSAELQFVAGTGSMSDNLHWDIRLSSVSGPYGTEGLSIRHYAAGVGHNEMSFNHMDNPGVSSTGVTITNSIGAMDGNDLMTGLSIDLLGNTYTGSGNEVRALAVGGITPSANASESAIVVGPGWDYAFIASQGNVGIGTETPNYRLEVAGTASVSQLFGAGLISCNTTSNKLQYNAASGFFSCANEQNARIENGEITVLASQNSLDFSANGFDLTASGTTEVLIALDYVNGPASRSIAQTITGHWDFTAPTSVSAALDVSGALTAGTYLGGGLVTCNGLTQKLTWSGGLFGCGTDQNTGGGGATGSIEIREFGAAFDSFPATVSFDPGKFNLTASGGADVTVSLDWGAGGPASRSANETISGAWTFTGAAAFNASPLGLTVANNASVSGALEVSGYASASKVFGAGLTDCVGTFNVIRWSASTGKFSCGTEGGGVRTESGETTIVANNNALNFNANRFALTASGGTETTFDLNLAGQWTFAGGVSVSTNPFEVGTNTLYVDPTTSRVGINTQHLSEALEIVGNASVSGAVYASTAIIGSGTLPAGYVLDVAGAAHFGNGLDANQTLLGFDVGHDLTMHYMVDQYGQSGFDGLMIRNGDPTESNIFSVYGSSDAQFNASSQDATRNSSVVVMNNPSVTSLTSSTRGLLTNKATTHDIALQYSFGGAAPIDAILIDTNPAANTINAIIINSGNQNIPFRVAGIGDANLLYTDGTSKVGIGTNAPLTKLEVQGTASASHLLTTGGLQVGGGSSVSFSRFGTNATDRGLSATSDLLISGKFEADSQAFFDAAASISANLEVGGTASVSGGLFANGGLTVVGQLTAGNASLSGGLELTSAAALLGINAGGRTDTMLEVGGTASISGAVRFGSSASVSTNLEVGGTASISGKVNIQNSASISQNIEASGYASASAYFGAGLTDCDSLDQRLAWTASGSNGGKFSCKSGAVNVTYTSGDANVPANGLSAMFLFSATNTTAFSIVIAGNNEMKMSTAGYISACSVVSNANVTAGVMKVVGRKNGATMGTNANQYCTMNTTNPRTNSEAIPAGVLTFVAGDTIGVAASANATWAPTTADIMISFTVTFPTGADLAETYYTHNDAVTPATVVTLEPGLFAGVTLASSAYDEKALGVISTAPGLVLGDGAGPGRKVYVALSGRVPVWVSDENGPIKPGDWLTTSSTPGVAMKATRAGRVIGQALTEHSSAGISQVVMFVKNTQYDGNQALQQMSAESSDAQTLLTMLTQPTASASMSSGILTDRLVAGLDIIAPTMTTRELSVEMLRSGSDSISFQELFQQHDELATLVAQMSGLASRSDALQQFIVETNTALTASDLSLAQSVASQSVRVDALNVRLANAEISLAALASASHALTYNDVVLFAGGLKVDSIGSIGDLLTFGSDTYFFGRPYFNDDTAGFAVIRAGTREVRVPFTAPYLEAPIVNASLMTTASQSVDDLLTENVRFAIASVSGDGFTVRLSANAAADIRLSWIALAVHNARTIFSQIPAEPTPTDVPAATVTATPTPETPAVTVMTTPDINPSPVASASETPALTPELTPTPDTTPTPTATADVVPSTTPEPTPTPVMIDPSPTESPVATDSAPTQ